MNSLNNYINYMSSGRKLPDFPSPQYAIKQDKPKLKQEVERTLSNAFFRETHYNSIIEQSPTYLIKDKKVHYQGRWERGLPNGRGIAIYSNHSYFEGNFINGEIEDPDGFLIMPNGAYYKGNIKKSILEGKGVLKHENYKYEGNWVNGKPQGKGNEQYGNGIRYNGDFVNGLKEGRGIYIDSSKVEEYDGQFKLGYMWGRGTFKVNHKLVYEGLFEKGKKVGKGRLITQQGVLSGFFENDVINGEGVFEWNDKKVYRGQFKDSLFHGEGILEMQGGKKLKGVWVNGHNDKLILCDT